MKKRLFFFFQNRSFTVNYAELKQKVQINNKMNLSTTCKQIVDDSRELQSLIII